MSNKAYILRHIDGFSPGTYLAWHISFEIVYNVFNFAKDYFLVKIYDP